MLHVNGYAILWLRIIRLALYCVANSLDFSHVHFFVSLPCALSKTKLINILTIASLSTEGANKYVKYDDLLAG